MRNVHGMAEEIHPSPIDRVLLADRFDQLMKEVGTVSSHAPALSFERVRRREHDAFLCRELPPRLGERSAVASRLVQEDDERRRPGAADRHEQVIAALGAAGCEPLLMIWPSAPAATTVARTSGSAAIMGRSYHGAAERSR